MNDDNNNNNIHPRTTPRRYHIERDRGEFYYNVKDCIHYPSLLLRFLSRLPLIIIIIIIIILVPE